MKIFGHQSLILSHIGDLLFAISGPDWAGVYVYSPVKSHLQINLSGLLSQVKSYLLSYSPGTCWRQTQESPRWSWGMEPAQCRLPLLGWQRHWWDNKKQSCESCKQPVLRNFIRLFSHLQAASCTLLLLSKILFRSWKKRYSTELKRLRQ